MYKLTETYAPNKLCEIAASSPTNQFEDSISGIIREQTESSIGHGYFDMGERKLREAFQNLGEGQAENFLANIKRIPFRDFFDSENSRIKEYLASSGTTGKAGAYYLIPIKLYTELQTEAVQADIVPQVSKTVLGPEALGSGTTCKIDIIKDGQYKFTQGSSGAQFATETLETVQATLDFTPVYAINFKLANDLLEDEQFDLLELHLREAGRQIGEKASDLALTALYTASDGDGTVNGPTTGTTASITKWIDTNPTGLDYAYTLPTKNGFTPDTMVITHHAMAHSLVQTGGAVGNDSPLANNFLTSGYPSTIAGMNIVYSDTDYLSNTQAYTLCKAIIFTKNYSLLSGRKRWMRVENYSQPVRDLKGAVVSFRQDSVTLYKDAISDYIEHS